MTTIDHDTPELDTAQALTAAQPLRSALAGLINQARAEIAEAVAKLDSLHLMTEMVAAIETERQMTLTLDDDPADYLTDPITQARWFNAIDNAQ